MKHLEGELDRLQSELALAYKKLEAKDSNLKKTNERLSKMREELLNERNHSEVLKQGLHYAVDHQLQAIKSLATEVTAGRRVWHGRNGSGIVVSVNNEEGSSRPYCVRFDRGGAHKYDVASMLKFMLLGELTNSLCVGKAREAAAAVQNVDIEAVNMVANAGQELAATDSSNMQLAGRIVNAQEPRAVSTVYDKHRCIAGCAALKTRHHPKCPNFAATQMVDDTAKAPDERAMPVAIEMAMLEDMDDDEFEEHLRQAMM